MNKYTLNQDQENYAEGSGRNILETKIGRKYLGLLEAKFESLIDERMDEEFSDE